MKSYIVILEGRWPAKWKEIAGFYTTRIVMADCEDQAAEVAIKRLLADLPDQLPGCPQPEINIDSVQDVEARDLSENTSGFSFYSDAD